MKPLKTRSYRFKFQITTLTWVLACVTAQAAPSDYKCYVDGPGLPFEETTGYQLNVARDGTEFKDSEKRAFDLLAGVLPPALKNLQALNYFERVPDGYTLENGAVGMYTGRGYRLGRRQSLSGYIHLAQSGTELEVGRFKGKFYENVIHEIAHALDFQLGNLSKKEEWRSLSTWDEDDTGTSGNFISWYAFSDPSEDFAESVAFFILDGDALLKKAPEKFEFISKKIFGGVRLDTESLRKRYLSELENLSGEARDQKISELRRQDYYACRIL